MNDDFKVTYTNHNKAYIPKLSGTDVYRSYLNLLPEDEAEDEVDESKKSLISEERKKILGNFYNCNLKKLNPNTHFFSNGNFQLFVYIFFTNYTAHFKSLSGQEQESQRKIWSQELSQIEKEITELKNQLGITKF